MSALDMILYGLASAFGIFYTSTLLESYLGEYSRICICLGLEIIHAFVSDLAYIKQAFVCALGEILYRHSYLPLIGYYTGTHTWETLYIIRICLG